MSKTNYSIEYNPASKTWCLYKNLESSQSLNFYPIVQSEKKDDCAKKLAEIKKKEKENKKKMRENVKKSWATVYRLYKNDVLIDTDTRANLIKKHKVPQNTFNRYFYKTGTKEFRAEKIQN